MRQGEREQTKSGVEGDTFFFFFWRKKKKKKKKKKQKKKRRRRKVRRGAERWGERLKGCSWTRETCVKCTRGSEKVCVRWRWSVLRRVNER